MAGPQNPIEEQVFVWLDKSFCSRFIVATIQWSTVQAQEGFQITPSVNLTDYATLK